MTSLVFWWSNLLALRMLLSSDNFQRGATGAEERAWRQTKVPLSLFLCPRLHILVCEASHRRHSPLQKTLRAVLRPYRSVPFADGAECCSGES